MSHQSAAGLPNDRKNGLPAYGVRNLDEYHIDKYAIVIKASYLKENILKLQSYGTRYRWDKQWEAAKLIAQRMEDLDYEVTIQIYDFNEKEWPNVIARKKGITDATKNIVLLSHFDTISDDPENNAPGADDNGSGTAILLESARILKDIDFDNTLIFCFFSNEEAGTAGSNYYAEAGKHANEQLVTVVSHIFRQYAGLKVVENVQDDCG